MKRHSQRLRDILRRGLAIAVTVPMMVSFAPVAFAEDGAGTGNGSATPSASSGLNLLASYDFSDGTATDTSGKRVQPDHERRCEGRSVRRQEQ